MVGEGGFIDNLMKGDLKVPGAIKQGNEARYCFEEFKVQPVCQVVNATTANPSGTADTANTAQFGTNVFEYVAKGTQTIIGLGSLAATGCSVSGDQADNDGREINFAAGITARAIRSYTVGRAFFARLKFSIAVVAGTDDCAFGFRKAEAYQTNLDDYDEMAVLNVISGDIKIETILNAATTTTTATTENWADTETHELRVDVAVDGSVTFAVDGAEPSVVSTFSFDAGEVVIPFMFFLQANASQTGAIVLSEFESSYV
ncbi:MAG TPA: hypothetical protein VMW50_03610 [Dehalococcoidia bacterium]|nr:hypothetical protein [Dehalococcoidia bacterium]